MYSAILTGGELCLRVPFSVGAPVAGRWYTEAMALLRPISALRLLTLAVTILLVTALFLSEGSFSVGFLLGAAVGLSIGVQAMVWNKQLQWHDEADRSDTIQMNPNQPQR
jgi:hypothetical protein